MEGLCAKIVILGLINLSNQVKIRFIPVNNFNIFSWETLYSITILGIIGCVFEMKLIFTSIIARPNGTLLPGIDTGNKNGAINIKHDNNPPCSPINVKKSSKLIPFDGISEDIRVMMLEVFSLDSFKIFLSFYYCHIDCIH